ncbi:MAG TPA: DinB family protein [Ktedonobacterales bacterium]
MPMPTPPAPGEEPTDEAELYRYHFRRLIGWYLEALDPLPANAFTWAPPAPGTNSLATICSHAISSAEWWTLSCVGDAPLERDRDAEFAAAAQPWSEMRGRFSAWLAQVEALVKPMTPERLQAISRHPAGDRMNRRCLTHTIEHLGLHLGHVELTIDWWKSAHGEHA